MDDTGRLPAPSPARLALAQLMNAKPDWARAFDEPRLRARDASVRPKAQALAKTAQYSCDSSCTPRRRATSRTSAPRGRRRSGKVRRRRREKSDPLRHVFNVRVNVTGPVCNLPWSTAIAIVVERNALVVDPI